jgi:beta-lactamase class A
MTNIPRRAFLGAALVLPLAGCAATAGPAPSTSASGSGSGSGSTSTKAPTPAPSPTASVITADAAFQRLEATFDAKLSVVLTDTATRASVLYRPDDRVAFCSTHKLFTSAFLLKTKSDAEMAEVIHYGKQDLVAHSPVTELHVDEGMTLSALCDAAIRVSDNTAANLLFRSLGGPAVFQQKLRSIGDAVTHSDRIETDLNSAVPGDVRDTTTARAWAKNVELTMLGDLLDDRRRGILKGWASGNAVTDTLIRAGVSKEWTVRDKSGSGSYGTRNDIGIIERPGQSTLVAAILTTRPTAGADATYDDALVAGAAKAAVAALA